jgi:carbon storage regulator
MLVLTRKLDEEIVIGDNISIKIVGLDHHQVKLGFEAPLEVIIHREEVQKAIKKKSN